MEENKHKKSRAIIITLIILLVLILAGYLIYKSRDAFGVKTSATISKIFSPLISSNNSKNLNTIDAQAGEDLKKGDSVSVFGTGSDNKLIVVKTTNGNVYGYANEDITNGNTGEITLSNTNTNDFWDSFSGFLGNIFNNDNNPTNPNTDNTCTNGSDNYPLCTTVNGQCPNGEVNPPLCNNNGTVCTNGADNFPLCNSIGEICQNGATNFPLCNNDGTQCLNGADNPLLCTTIGGQCLNGATNPPDCNNVPVDSCTNGADNFPECTTIGGQCLNGATNPTLCNEGGTPDLTVVGNVFPINAKVNTPIILSSSIMNIGGGSTLHSFSSFFYTDSTDGPNGAGMMKITVTPTLSAGVSNTITASYTFPEIGEYSIRVCVDKSGFSDKGTVPESNEDNNCGPSTLIKVDSSLPQPCIPPNLTDTQGKCIDPSQCVSPNVINGDKCEDCLYPNLIDTKTNQCIDISLCVPPRSINGNKCEECAPPDLIDTETNQCIDASECVSPKVINGDKCEIQPNVCLFIDQNPIEFTAEEKADLADLLRKYYLIAPTLKTKDDILLTYSEIAQYNNFADQLSTLTKQCYSQTSDVNYAGPKTKWGNPWYQYSTNRGSYVDTNPSSDPTNINLDCKYISGWFSGKITTENEEGVKVVADCENLNSGLYLNTPASCSTPLIVPPTDESQKYYYDLGIEKKCVWNEGVNISEMEKILNVW